MYVGQGSAPAPQQLGWGSGSSSPSSASGGPALRLCSRPQLLAPSSQGASSYIPSFWASSSQGAVQPSPASGVQLSGRCSSRPQLLGVQLSGCCAAVPSFWGFILRRCAARGGGGGGDSSGLGLPVTSGVRLLLLRCWWPVSRAACWLRTPALSTFVPLDCLLLSCMFVCFSWKFSDMTR